VKRNIERFPADFMFQLSKARTSSAEASERLGKHDEQLGDILMSLRFSPLRSVIASRRSSSATAAT
jgi:hypothetical protein